MCAEADGRVFRCAEAGAPPDRFTLKNPKIVFSHTFFNIKNVNLRKSLAVMGVILCRGGRADPPPDRFKSTAISATKLKTETLQQKSLQKKKHKNDHLRSSNSNSPFGTL